MSCAPEKVTLKIKEEEEERSNIKFAGVSVNFPGCAKEGKK